MNPLDNELRSAFRRVEPPPDFAKRVLSCIQATEQKPGWRQALVSRLASRFKLARSRRLRWVTACALACLIAVAAVQYRRYERRKVEGEMARAQVMLALRIASDKLNVALKSVERVDRGQPAERARRKSSRRMEHL